MVSREQRDARTAPVLSSGAGDSWAGVRWGHGSGSGWGGAWFRGRVVVERGGRGGSGAAGNAGQVGQPRTDAAHPLEEVRDCVRVQGVHQSGSRAKSPPFAASQSGPSSWGRQLPANAAMSAGHAAPTRDRSTSAIHGLTETPAALAAALVPPRFRHRCRSSTGTSFRSTYMWEYTRLGSSRSRRVVSS